MTNCEHCKREIKEGEHCYGPKEHEWSVSPKWVFCISCARKYCTNLITPSNEGLE